MAAIYTDQVTAKASNSEPPTGSFKKSSFEKGLFLPSLGNWKRQPNNNNKNLLTSSCPTPTKHQQKKKQKQDSSLLIISVVLKVELVCYHATQKHTLALKFPFMAMPSGPNREHIYPLVCRSSSHSDFSLGLCWQG